jgi:hypothetical protein
MGKFKNPVGESTFAVVDMGDNAKIPDVVYILHELKYPSDSYNHRATVRVAPTIFIYYTKNIYFNQQ